MSTLYIIGNGFDRFNGLETTYANFHNFVIQNYPDLENTIEEYFSFETSKDYLWKNFENDLSTFNHKSFFNDLNNIDILSENFSPSEAFGLEDDLSMEVDNLIDKIKDVFTEWINGLEFPTQKNNNLQFPTDSVFINFNYTDTLEQLYSIAKNKILYIHNNTNDFQGELIFGHGKSEENSPQIEELDEDGNSNRTIFTDSENIARYPFYALQKNTHEILENHEVYFKNLKHIAEIIVLGQSLGMADWPYFKKINKLLPDANWKISYYSDQEKETLITTAKEIFNIPQNNIQMIKMEKL